jgi:hypothetical protein
MEAYMLAKLMAWIEEHHENFVSWVEVFAILWLVWV